MANHRVCDVEGCGGKHFGRGYCRSHHARWYRTGSVDPDMPIGGLDLCKVPDCGTEHYAKGYCVAHYTRWREYGDPQAHIPVGAKPRARKREHCKVDNCTKSHHARGYCVAHYHKWKKYGDPQPDSKPTGRTKYESPLEELAARSVFRCPIEWDGAIDSGGSGVMVDRQRPHRLVWETAHGEKLGSRRLVHTCGNRKCLTLEHMELEAGRRVFRCHIPGCGEELFDETRCEYHWDMERKGETWVTNLATTIPTA